MRSAILLAALAAFAFASGVRALVSLARPQWPVQFDEDKTLARKTREKTLAELARSRELVFAPHFPFPGHIVAAGDTYAWQPAVP